MKTMRKLIFSILLLQFLGILAVHAYRDEETGTFITRDPAGYVDGPNLYTYVKQNPWTHFDLLGLQTAGQYFTDLALQESGARTPEFDDPGMQERVFNTPDLVTPVVEVMGATGTMVTIAVPGPTITGGVIAPSARKGASLWDNVAGTVLGWFKKGKAAAPAATSAPTLTAKQISNVAKAEVEAVEIIARVKAQYGGFEALNMAANGTPNLDALSQAAAAVDRGGLTAAGRSLTKHGAGARPGNTLFPAAQGTPAAINQAAQNVVDDILTTPGSIFQNSYRGRFGPTIEVTVPGGRGIVYDATGKFLFFME